MKIRISFSETVSEYQCDCGHRLMISPSNIGMALDLAEQHNKNKHNGEAILYANQGEKS